MPGAGPGMTSKGVKGRKSHRPYFDHIRHKMAQQVLDAVLESGGR
jgi:hypothetical protein